MNMKFLTESGSVYSIDEVNKTWIREQGEGAATLRSVAGEFFTHTPIEIGQSVTFTCPPINPPLLRIIITTHVVEILNA